VGGERGERGEGIRSGRQGGLGGGEKRAGGWEWVEANK